MADSDRFFRLMELFRGGDRAAGNELVDLCYAELRRMAGGKMRRERQVHTWQPTALVHELYLELAKARKLERPSGENGESERAAFFALAGHMMRRLLIHHARPMYRRVEHVAGGDAPGGDPQAMHEVEDALAGLAAVDPKLRMVVEMKVLEGLTVDEIAARLECSPRSVANYWNVARRWLQKEWAAGRQQ